MESEWPWCIHLWIIKLFDNIKQFILFDQTLTSNNKNTSKTQHAYME